MEIERGGDQQQARRVGTQRNAGKISAAFELAPFQVPLHAHPVIQGLKRQVDVSYVKVRGPHVYLLIHPDGTTNIPAPQVRTREREVVHELLSLKVRHFERPLDLFGVEMTASPCVCAGCGTREEVARLGVYVGAGIVVRCCHCEAVMIRIVEAGERIWLDLSGTISLELTRP